MTGVQADASVGIGSWRTIFQVATYGEADRGKLTADLVVATGVKVDFDEARAFAIFSSPRSSTARLAPETS